MKIFNLNRGQALITLLFFMIVTITITSAAVMVSLVNSASTSTLDWANSAYYAAEEGAENALLRLLRNPMYTGETITVDGGTVTISVSGVSPIVIVSTAKITNSLRKIKVEANYSNNVLTVTSWKEVL